MGKKEKSEVENGGVRVLAVPVPVAEIEPAEYQPRHVDVMLHGTLPEVMKRVRVGLMAQNERLREGRLVENNADVVRWLLEGVEALI